MTNVTKLHGRGINQLAIKLTATGSSPDAYILVDENGEALPHQIETVLKSTANALPTFTVTFQAGEKGLRVIDNE
tara:strand:+ start:201 stop:425 length:225 start_codon:yes stop_codon:yes gene_type:complete